MNLAVMYDIQNGLREKIIEKHNLQGVDLKENYILSLSVELAELANETRCFKHWSTKGPSERSVILEEYADVLHFFLEIGLDIGYRIEKVEPYRFAGGLTRQFIALNRAVSSMGMWIHYPDLIKDGYKKAFMLFGGLGEMLGFSWEEVEMAYLAKNVVNHVRQESSY